MPPASLNYRGEQKPEKSTALLQSELIFSLGLLLPWHTRRRATNAPNETLAYRQTSTVN